MQEVQKEKQYIYKQLQQVLEGAYDEQEIYMYLRTAYLEAQQHQQQVQQTKEQLAGLKIKMDGGQSKLDRYTTEMAELLNEAQVPNEQAYYEMYEQFEQQKTS